MFGCVGATVQNVTTPADICMGGKIRMFSFEYFWCSCICFLFIPLSLDSCCPGQSFVILGLKPNRQLGFKKVHLVLPKMSFEKSAGANGTLLNLKLKT